MKLTHRWQQTIIKSLITHTHEFTAHTREFTAHTREFTDRCA
jgi:hypothetical protein